MTNGGVKCDVVLGPCACGAWHTEDEARDRARERAATELHDDIAAWDAEARKHEARTREARKERDARFARLNDKLGATLERMREKLHAWDTCRHLFVTMAGSDVVCCSLCGAPPPPAVIARINFTLRLFRSADATPWWKRAWCSVVRGHSDVAADTGEASFCVHVCSHCKRVRI